MPLLKIATVTATHFEVHLSGSIPPTVARAMGQWCMTHGIDPALVPETSPITRDEAGCRIIYHEIQETPAAVREAVGGDVMAAPVIMQGDTPPAPFPPEVLAWAERIK